MIPEKKIIYIWSFAVFFATMNSTMFNVALPSVQVDLSINISVASLIISGYSVVLAISTLTFSRLSEFIPILKLLITGIVLLSFGSIIGFFSKHFVLVLITRLVQAIGAGSIVSLSLVLISRYIPFSRRGRAMALTSSAAVLGLGLGPVLGGIIDQFLGWNFLFLVTVLIVFLIPMFIYLLPKEEITKVKFDSIGCALTCLSVVCLMVFFSTFKVIFILIFILLITLTSNHFLRVKSPFIKANLLKNRKYTTLLYIGFVSYFVYFSTLFILPFILTDIFQLESSEIGFLVFPGAILSAVAANFIGRLIGRFGNVSIILAGQVFLIISTILFAFLATSSTLPILISYLFMSPGFTALSTSVRNEISKILHVDEIGSGMGIVQLTQFFGGSFGVTITGTILTIQEGLSQVIMYRNIYIVLIVVTITSILMVFLYRRKLETGVSDD
ncbi:MFS transporter [Oceanobacillus rekensis]|uniref:MFS transporter n=1 Tax=Oceanobacillus rekensis TaxID=937927 RepID=UPI001FEB74B5|nr:MFS transporter [Oceanobacillus rekensis]